MEETIAILLVHELVLREIQCSSRVHAVLYRNTFVVVVGLDGVLLVRKDDLIHTEVDVEDVGAIILLPVV